MALRLQNVLLLRRKCLALTLLLYISTSIATVLDVDTALGDECKINPENSEARFRLLDPRDGIPFINVQGTMRKSPEIIDPIPEYYFTRSPGDNKVYDLRLGSSYAALFASGQVGFRDHSSNGSFLIGNGEGTHMTTIFTITCDGTISIRLPDNLRYDFAYNSANHTVHVRPVESIKPVRQRNTALYSFPRRAEKGFFHVGDSWEPFTFLAGPMRVSDHFQIGYSPRCPAMPFGLQSYVKPNARPAGFNGCGADNGMKFPELRFTICCNNHDLCYDSCGMTWEDCNDNFHKCMLQECADSYKNIPANATTSDNTTSWSQWGCNGLAETYADAVGTRIGAWAFSIANTDRCTCGCPSGTTNCTDICLKDCKDRCNIVDCSAETKAVTSVSAKTTSSSSIVSSKTATSTTKTISGGSATRSSTREESTKGIWWWPFPSSSSNQTASVPKPEHESGYTQLESAPSSSWWWPFR